MIALTILLAASAAGAASLLLRAATLRARFAEAQLERLRAEVDESGYTELQGRVVVILTTEKQSYRGVLAKSYRDGHKLASPSLVQDAQAADLGGEIFIDRSKVALIQIPEPARGS